MAKNTSFFIQDRELQEMENAASRPSRAFTISITVALVVTALTAAGFYIYNTQTNTPTSASTNTPTTTTAPSSDVYYGNLTLPAPTPAH